MNQEVILKLIPLLGSEEGREDGLLLEGVQAGVEPARALAMGGVGCCGV
jgi:hypothetical protein